MKRLVTLASLAACLFCTTACDFSLKNASLAIRKAWERMNSDKQGGTVTIPATKAELEAISKLEEVPGEALSEEEKIRLVKAQAFIAACSKLSAEAQGEDQKLADMALSLNKTYPPLPPVNSDDLHLAFRDPMPDQIGEYRFIVKDILPQLDLAPDEPIPHALFHPNQEYFNIAVSHAGQDMVYHNAYIIDRGSYGGWVRTAAWYYQRKGFINKYDSEKYQFSGTTEKDGRTWVVWTQKGTQRKRFITWWNDRFMVWVDGYESPEVVEEVFNTGWMDTVK